MKRSFTLYCLGCALFLLQLLPTAARAQPTVLDASYPMHRIYQPATVEQALQLASGARMVLGEFRRANGQPAARLARYTAAGAPDLAFQSATAAYNWVPTDLAEDNSGRLLVSLAYPFSVGAQLYSGVVRLLPGGAIDPSFAPQPNTLVTSLLVQADGKVLLSGTFTSYGSSATAGLVRLNADGTFDQAYATNLNGGLTAPFGVGYAATMALQADGKLLLGGMFRNIGGQTTSSLARLNTDGTLDASFVPPTLRADVNIATLAVVPGGGVYIAARDNQLLMTGSTRRVARLLANGALDASFTPPPFVVASNPYNGSPNMVVQPDGKPLLHAEYSSAGGFGVVRFTNSGAYDPSWTPAATEQFAQVYSLQLLPSGELLLGGMPQHLASRTSVPAGTGVFSSTGAFVPGFAPVLQTLGIIYTTAVQPDGKLLIGGNFSEINGTAVRNIARLNADGSIDPAFTAAASANAPVYALVVQPDGKIMAGGAFDQIAGQAQAALVRLLPTGALDPGFTVTPALRPPAPGDESFVDKIALQPDGQVLAGGYLRFVGSNRYVFFPRFSTTGLIDPTFRQVAAINDEPYSLLVQPDGNILVGCSFQLPGLNQGQAAVVRLLPNGSLDPAFVLTRTSNTRATFIFSMARYPDGRLLIAGEIDTLGAVGSTGVMRLLPNGTPDPSFQSAFQFDNSGVQTICLQPNNRLLVSGRLNGPGLLVNTPLTRLLTDGSADADFAPTDLPPSGILSIAVQPDGGIIIAGNFEQVGNDTRYCLARLLAPHVLHVAAGQAATRTAAYPVPAHHQLYLRLDAASRPQQVQLLDALGRPVLSQAVSQAELTLDTTHLPAGVYLLRVRYASGETVTRRVVRD